MILSSWILIKEGRVEKASLSNPDSSSERGSCVVKIFDGSYDACNVVLSFAHRASCQTLSKAFVFATKEISLLLFFLLIMMIIEALDIHEAVLSFGTAASFFSLGE